MGSQQLKSIERQMADIKTQLHMDRRRLAKLNVGQALQLQIDLTNLKTRKQQIVDSMATRPVTSFDDDRSQQLKSIERQMADIKTQLHMDRRRLAKLNVGQA